MQADDIAGQAAYFRDLIPDIGIVAAHLDQLVEFALGLVKPVLLAQQVDVRLAHRIAARI